MIATFLIEIFLAGVAFWRYKLSRLSQLAILMLVFLGTFQLAEYNICAVSWGLDSLTWSRVGYVAITMLPPLGIHLAYEMAGAKKRPLLLPAYGAAAGFMVFFMFIGHALTGQACLGNYVIFTQAPDSVWLYALYYYGLLVTGITLSIRLAREQPKRIKQGLYGLAAGYMIFLLPTITVNVIDHSTIAGIPSIMCGFAVLYAIILSFWILPHTAKRRMQLEP
jgi:hypothetical protein